MKTIQKVAVASLVATTAMAAGDASAAVDMFLKIDGIKGESMMKGEEGAIQISSVEFSATSTVTTGTTGTGVASGKRQFSPVVVQKLTDRSSVALFKAFAAAERLKGTVEIDFVKSSPQGAFPFLKIELGDVIVSSYSLSGGAGSQPTESISFNYVKIEESFTAQSPTGAPEPAVTASFDLVTQKLD
jgi:type VI secretion system secreted protein Hcp